MSTFTAAARNSPQKAVQNEILGTLARLVGVGKADSALVVDDVDAATATALHSHVGLTRSQIYSWQHAPKVAVLQRAVRKSTVEDGDVIGGIASLMKRGIEPVVIALDLMNDVDTVVCGGMLPLALSALDLERACLLTVTFCVSRRAQDALVNEGGALPPRRIRIIVEKALATQGSSAKAHKIFALRYGRMYHMVFLCTPTSLDARERAEMAHAARECAERVAAPLGLTLLGDSEGTYLYRKSVATTKVLEESSEEEEEESRTTSSSSGISSCSSEENRFRMTEGARLLKEPSIHMLRSVRLSRTRGGASWRSAARAPAASPPQKEAPHALLYKTDMVRELGSSPQAMQGRVVERCRGDDGHFAYWVHWKSGKVELLPSPALVLHSRTHLRGGA